MEVVEGVDVSVMQNVVPWDVLAQQGFAFAFIRCKVGNNTGTDTRYAENVRRARGAGLYAAPYFFPFPLRTISIASQVQGFLQAAVVDGDMVGTMKGDLPPAYDLEWPPPEEWQKRGCTADQICDYAIAQLDALHSAFQALPVLYSYPYFLQALSSAKNFAVLAKYPLWIAGGPQYVNGNGSTPRRGDDGSWVDKAPLARGWSDNWLFWQHDGNGGRKLPGGIDCDFNVYRFDRVALGQLAQVIDGPSPLMIPDPATMARLTSIAMNADDDAVHASRVARASRMIADATAA